MTKVDEYWEKLFSKYHILEKIEKDGVFKIESKDIKSIDNSEIHAEPRLLTKFDRSEDLPVIFSENDLSILPVKRGTYIISHIKTHKSFKDDENIEIFNIKPEYFSVPSYFESINSNNIPSEAIALNCAYISGIIEDFIGDKDMKPTVDGRMKSESFDFYILDTVRDTSHKINVTNAQIEIDAAYEGLNYLTLIEAKCDISDDFLVRQLYYPYRLWKSKVNKDVKMVFLTYSNKIFTLYEYKFENINCYNSLKLVKVKRYTLENIKIYLKDIQGIIDSINQITSEPATIPFPQANNFERIINICELLKNKTVSKDSIAKNNYFTGRQADYYINACRYLGLVEAEGNYRLSKLGKEITELPQKERQLAFVKCILSKNVFNKVMKITMDSGEIPVKSEIINIMKNHLSSMSEDTCIRRSQTVKSWITWILSLIEK